MPDAVVDPVVEANYFLTGAYIFVVQIIRKKKKTMYFRLEYTFALEEMK